MPQLYLSIGMFLWLAIDACFDGARVDYRRMLKTTEPGDSLPALIIIINMVAFVWFWPFVVGYKLIMLMSAPMER